MKRLVIWVGVLLAATVVSAKEFQSSFGFEASIPDGWLVMTKQEIKANPALAEAKGAQVGNINPDLLRDLKAKVESGSVEVLFNQTTSDATFADNINVMVRRGQIPASQDKLAQSCEAFAGKLAKYAGRPLAVARCEGRELGMFRAVYLEWEGVVAGTVTMQYQIQRPDGQVLQVTATCRQANAAKIRAELDEIVQSIRFS